jgi:hypothetical protein
MVQRRWYRLVGLVVVYAATIAGLSVVERGYGNLSSSRILFNGLVVVPALMSGSLAWIWYRLSRKADRQVGIFAQTHTVLTDAGLLWPSGSGNEKGVARRGMSAGGASPNHPVTVPWSAFSEVIISDRVALLFLRKSSAFLIVPRAKLVKATDWPVLAAFLQARIQ